MILSENSLLQDLYYHLIHIHIHGIYLKWSQSMKHMVNISGKENMAIFSLFRHHPFSTGFTKKSFETSFETSFAIDDLKNCFRPHEDLDHFLARCSKELEGLPPPMKRNWRKPMNLCQEISKSVEYLVYRKRNNTNEHQLI